MPAEVWIAHLFVVCKLRLCVCVFVSVCATVRD